jgi:hypothetical protein
MVHGLMGAIRNMNWTRLRLAVTVGGAFEPDSIPRAAIDVLVRTKAGVMRTVM